MKLNKLMKLVFILVIITGGLFIFYKLRTGVGEWRTYQDQTYRYQFSYPSNWKLENLSDFLKETVYASRNQRFEITSSDYKPGYTGGDFGRTYVKGADINFIVSQTNTSLDEIKKVQEAPPMNRKFRNTAVDGTPALVTSPNEDSEELYVVKKLGPDNETFIIIINFSSDNMNKYRETFDKFVTSIKFTK